MSSPTPAEVAARDQARALVRDLAAGGMPAIFADYPPAGTRCCWCNCPATAGPEHQCAGCPHDAEADLRIYPQPDDAKSSWPVCRGHYDDALRVLQLFLAAAMPGC